MTQQSVKLDTLLHHRDEISLRLQTAILSLCKESYSAENGLEVDGIICVSVLNSREQHVIKIHKQLHDVSQNSKAPESNLSNLRDENDKSHERNKNCYSEKDMSPMSNKKNSAILVGSDQEASYKGFHIRMQGEQMFATNIGNDLGRHSLPDKESEYWSGEVSDSTPSNIQTEVTNDLAYSPHVLKGASYLPEANMVGSEISSRSASLSEMSKSDEENYVVIKVEPEESDHSIEEQEYDNDRGHQLDSKMEVVPNWHPTDGDLTTNISSELFGTVDSDFKGSKSRKIIKPEIKQRSCTQSSVRDRETNLDHSVQTEVFSAEKQGVKISSSADLNQENLLGCLPSLSFQELFPNTQKEMPTPVGTFQKYVSRHNIQKKGSRKRNPHKWSIGENQEFYCAPSSEFYQDPSEEKWYSGPNSAESESYNNAAPLNSHQSSVLPLTSFTISPSSPVVPKYTGCSTPKPSAMILKHNLSILMRSSGTQREKKYFCRHCGAGFTMQCTKIRHEKTTCGASKYTCTVCKKVFNRSDSKIRHMFNTHGMKIIL